MNFLGSSGRGRNEFNRNRSSDDDKPVLTDGCQLNALAFIGVGASHELAIANVYAAHGIGRWIAIQSSLPRKLLRGQRHFWRSRGRAAPRGLGKHILTIKIPSTLLPFTPTTTH